MKHAFVMDPLDAVKPWKDTSYFLMRACVERGHQVFHLDQADLFLVHDEVYGSLERVDVHADMDRPFTPAGRETVPLRRMDVVWIRTDPPFDRRYFYATLLLDCLPPATRVVNRPAGIRNCNEKLAALKLPDFTPDTLVTHDAGRIVGMARRHGRVTVKPVDGFGGKGILFFSPDDDPGILREATADGRHWVIVQQYLEAARDGDKRILLLEGEPLGAILRVHARGSELNNMDAGGTPNPASLDERDREICRAIRPLLVEEGVFFAGIDVIGGMLIEVNVTSPTGLQEMTRFDNIDYHHRIVEALEA